MSRHQAVGQNEIIIAFGANLPTQKYGAPSATLKAALEHLGEKSDIEIVKVSPFYETAPVPVSDQPWYVNGVALIATHLEARDLLDRLHEIEAAFGRERHKRNEARVVDLDLISYRNQIVQIDGGMQIPHPRMHERAFVLIPLSDICPDWVHPVLNESVKNLIDNLPENQMIRKMQHEG